MTTNPIPFAERLPGPEDCNEDGFYWCCGYCCGYEVDPEERLLWTLSNQEDEDFGLSSDQASRCTHWLPFHAIPLLP